MSRFRTLRGRLTAIAVLIAAVALLALTLGFNAILSGLLSADADTRLRAQASTARAAVGVRDGHLALRAGVDVAALDHDLWIYEGTRSVLRPVAAAAVQHAADGLAGRVRAFDDLGEREYRLYAVPAGGAGTGGPAGTIVVGESLAAYERSTDVAQVASLALGVLVLLAVAALMWTIVGRALGPVRAMTRSAADWSEHDPQRRFGAGGRPDELGELARTFNALLDRVATSLRHEQRLSAELSHELRTPLARIVAEVELLQRRARPAPEREAAFAAIARSAGQMSDILETLMAAARADARLDHGRSDVGAVLAELAASWDGEAAARGVALDVDEPAAPLSVGVAGEVAARALAPLLDNALRHAATRVTITARRVDGTVVVAVADDGPGVPVQARAQIFEPGVRLGERAGAADHAGAGLGLGLARRLARAAGGDVTLEGSGPGPGARFVLRLPA